MNSFYVLLAFLAFTGLGYLSYVRIVYKLRFPEGLPALQGVKTKQFLSFFLRGIAQSCIFVSLPAVSILLFWGWGPALLWLVISHLILDTLFNFIVSNPDKTLSPLSAAEFFADFESAKGEFRALLAQIALVLVLAMVTSLLAKLIDQQSGLVFTLIGVFFAIQLLQGNHGAFGAIARLLASAGVLTLCLLFSKQLGISIYGSWAPVPEYVSWLVFENSTLLALSLIFVGFQVSQNVALRRGISSVAGSIICALVIAAIVILALKQPLLDAPIMSVENRSGSLPSLPSLLFFVNGGFLLSLVCAIWLGKFNSMAEPPSSQTRFFLFQGMGLANFLIALVLCLGLASAIGIGAWNTHFIDWDQHLNLQRYFALASVSLQSLVGLGGDSGSLPQTLFMSGLCLAGVCLMIFLWGTIRGIAQQAESEAQTAGESDLATTITTNQNAHQFIIFLLCCYFLYGGITITFWLGTMALVWVMMVDYLSAHSAELKDRQLVDSIHRGFTLAVFTLGSLQLLWLSVEYLQQGLYYAGLVLLALLIIAIGLCRKNIIIIFKALKDQHQSTIFDR